MPPYPSSLASVAAHNRRLRSSSAAHNNLYFRLMASIIGSSIIDTIILYQQNGQLFIYDSVDTICPLVLAFAAGSERQPTKEGRSWTLDFSTPGMPCTLVAKFPGIPLIVEGSFSRRKLTPGTSQRLMRWRRWAGTTSGSGEVTFPSRRAWSSGAHAGRRDRRPHPQDQDRVVRPPPGVEASRGDRIRI